MGTRSRIKRAGILLIIVVIQVSGQPAKHKHIESLYHNIEQRKSKFEKREENRRKNNINNALRIRILLRNHKKEKFNFELLNQEDFIFAKILFTIDPSITEGQAQQFIKAKRLAESKMDFESGKQMKKVSTAKKFLKMLAQGSSKTKSRSNTYRNKNWWRRWNRWVGKQRFKTKKNSRVPVVMIILRNQIKPKNNLLRWNRGERSNPGNGKLLSLAQASSEYRDKQLLSLAQARSDSERWRSRYQQIESEFGKLWDRWKEAVKTGYNRGKTRKIKDFEFQ